MGKTIYNVLWVENDPTIVEGYKFKAYKKNINLVHFDNWEEAEAELESNFSIYSALILDANCSFGKGEIESSYFLIQVKTQLVKICTARKSEIPWYILSAGTMDNIDLVVNGISRDRNSRNDVWGKVYYSKLDQTDVEQLFDNILKIASDNDINRILYRFKDTFDVLQDSSIMDPEAKKNMFPILKGLYMDIDPDFDVELYYNQLRQQIEYIFKAAQNKNLLPETCIGPKNVILEHSRRFLSGEVDPILKYQLGNGEDSSDIVFSGILADTLEYLLKKAANTKSHTGSTRCSQFLLYGCALQLCALIEHFGNYIRLHNNPEENRRLWHEISEIQAINDKVTGNITKSVSEYNGKKYLLEFEDGNFHCEAVFVPNIYSQLKGKVVILRNVSINTGKTKDKYKFKAESVELAN